MQSTIPDMVVGSLYKIQRRYQGIPVGGKLTAANFLVKDTESTSDTDSLINISVTETNTFDGVVSDTGETTHTSVVDFIVSGLLTATLVAGRSYYYRIKVTTDYAGVITAEEGQIVPLTEITDKGTASSTNADGIGSTYSDRVKNLIDTYLDNVLHDFRQVRVWDEHARRSGDDGKTLMLTYQNWNSAFVPQVFDGNNNQVVSSKVKVDYRKGLVTVDDDTGYNDYFITYEFDLFPPKDLLAFLNISLQEINATAEQNTHLNNYTSIDGTPQFWDAPLVYGASAKAFKRLSTDGIFWKNFLIPQDGVAGQQLAADACEYYTAQFDDLRHSVKRGKYLATPSSSYSLSLS